MLKSILSLLLLSLFWAPMQAQELVVRQVNDIYVFALENEILTIKEVIRLLPEGTEQRRLLESGRFYSAAGPVFAATGGAALGLGFAYALIGTEGDNPNYTSIGFLGFGVGSVALGFTLARIGDRKIRRAVTLYNTGAPRVPETGMRLRLGNQPSGLGLALQF